MHGGLHLSHEERDKFEDIYEEIEMLNLLKKNTIHNEARENNMITTILNVKPSSFDFVIDKAIRLLKEGVIR